MARSAYCNSTSDLTAILPNISDYQEKRIVTDFVLHSGSIYKSSGTGYVGLVFEDGIQLTASTSISGTTSGKFFYDSNTDILYVFSSDIDAFEYQIGVDWDAYLLTVVKQATEIVDSELASLFPIPIPKSTVRLGGYEWDYPLVRSTALRACSLVIDRDNKELANTFVKDSQTIVNEYLSGTKKFSWDFSPSQVGHGVLSDDSSNTSTVRAYVSGTYTGKTNRWVIKVTTAGAIGTGKVSLSTDNGVTYGTALDTTWEQIYLESGLYLRFVQTDSAVSATLILNDKWYLDVFSRNEEVKSNRINSIRIEF